MSSLFLVKVTEWTTYGIGETAGYERVYICEELFRPLHVRDGKIGLNERHTVKLHGHRRNNFRPLVPGEDILVATLETGPNGRIFASKWNFLSEYNRLANRHELPPFQAGETFQPVEMLVVAG